MTVIQTFCGFCARFCVSASSSEEELLVEGRGCGLSKLGLNSSAFTMGSWLDLLSTFNLLPAFAASAAAASMWSGFSNPQFSVVGCCIALFCGDWREGITVENHERKQDGQDI